MNLGIKQIRLAMFVVLSGFSTAQADFFQGNADDVSGTVRLLGTGNYSDANSNGDGTFTGRQVAENFNNVDFDPTIGEVLKLTWWGRVADPDISRTNFRVDFHNNIMDQNEIDGPSEQIGFTQRLSLGGTNFQRFNVTDLGQQSTGLHLMQYETYFDQQALADFLDTSSEYWISVVERDESTGPWPESAPVGWRWAGAMTDNIMGDDWVRNPAFVGSWIGDLNDTNDGTGRAFSLEATTSVPEPGSWVLMSVFAGFGGYRRRKRLQAITS